MLYRVGRFLQLVGLILLPIGIAGQALGKIDLREMLTYAGAGVFVFFVGYLLQQAGKPR